MGGEKIEGVSFSLGNAVRLGINYIKRRRDRAIINVASVALGIAFLTTLLFTDSFYRVHTATGGASLRVEAYQYWLMIVAIVVSVVGITNAMLIAVYERYKEIGTMKCLGALDRHVLMILLVEAFIQGAGGGLLGFLMGIGGALLSTGFTVGFGVIFRVPALETLTVLVGSMILSTVLSVVATIYPAMRAARLDPVEALSYEL
jgi:putative ABC transport system permease protein